MHNCSASSRDVSVLAWVCGCRVPTRPFENVACCTVYFDLEDSGATSYKTALCFARNRAVLTLPSEESKDTNSF
jgi:hypothetical protein